MNGASTHAQKPQAILFSFDSVRQYAKLLSLLYFALPSEHFSAALGFTPNALWSHTLTPASRHRTCEYRIHLQYLQVHVNANSNRALKVNHIQHRHRPCSRSSPHTICSCSIVRQFVVSFTAWVPVLFISFIILFRFISLFAGSVSSSRGFFQLPLCLVGSIN